MLQIKKEFFFHIYSFIFHCFIVKFDIVCAMVVMVNVLNSRFHVSILEWKKNIISKQLIDILLSTGISEVIHQFIVV